MKTNLGPAGYLPASLAYALLAAGLFLATAPVWRLLLFGTQLTMEELLSLRCY